MDCCFGVGTGGSGDGVFVSFGVKNRRILACPFCTDSFKSTFLVRLAFDFLVCLSISYFASSCISAYCEQSFDIFIFHSMVLCLHLKLHLYNLIVNVYIPGASFIKWITW